MLLRGHHFSLSPPSLPSGLMLTLYEYGSDAAAVPPVPRMQRRKMVQNGKYPKIIRFSFYNIAAPRIVPRIMFARCAIRCYHIHFPLFLFSRWLLAAGTMRTAHNNTINLFICMFPDTCYTIKYVRANARSQKKVPERILSIKKRKCFDLPNHTEQEKIIHFRYSVDC